eukprot:12415369-Karenia_brevis.AAC.1
MHVRNTNAMMFKWLEVDSDSIPVGNAKQSTTAWMANKKKTQGGWQEHRGGEEGSWTTFCACHQWVGERDDEGFGSHGGNTAAGADWHIEVMGSHSQSLSSVQ